jgi:hypothetical protein
MDGTADEFSFGPRFTSFLVGYSRTLPRILRWCLPSVMGLLVALARDEVLSESMLAQERKEKKDTEDRAERRTKDGGHIRERRKKATQKTLLWGGGAALVSLNKNELATASDLL